ncbi:hypothetical protein BC938DRAFT_471091, partial [Jimgerdemannia flammicorona]
GICDPTAADTPTATEPAATTPPSVGANGTPKKRVYFADHVPTGRLSTYIVIESWDDYVAAPPSPDREDSPPGSPVEEPPFALPLIRSAITPSPFAMTLEAVRLSMALAKQQALALRLMQMREERADLDQLKIELLRVERRVMVAQRRVVERNMEQTKRAREEMRVGWQEVKTMIRELERARREVGVRGDKRVERGAEYGAVLGWVGWVRCLLQREIDGVVRTYDGNGPELGCGRGQVEKRQGDMERLETEIWFNGRKDREKEMGGAVFEGEDGVIECKEFGDGFAERFLPEYWSGAEGDGEKGGMARASIIKGEKVSDLVCQKSSCEGVGEEVRWFAYASRSEEAAESPLFLRGPPVTEKRFVEGSRLLLRVENSTGLFSASTGVQRDACMQAMGHGVTHTDTYCSSWTKSLRDTGDVECRLTLRIAVGIFGDKERSKKGVSKEGGTLYHLPVGMGGGKEFSKRGICLRA